MADILHTFTIKAAAGKVFDAITTRQGLDNWWTRSSETNPWPGGTYILDFGPGYTWKAVVSGCEVNKAFELQMTEADNDWLNTKVGFSLLQKEDHVTEVSFCHKGWPEANGHFKISSYCWAMYLRILKRFIESGEQVPYERRLEV